MYLAFSRSRADRGPGDEVGNVLRRCRIEEFATGRHPKIADVQKQPPSDPQASINIETFVETGIIDQPLPSNRGARLFEIDAHDDFEVLSKTSANARKPPRVIERGLRVVY